MRHLLLIALLCSPGYFIKAQNAGSYKIRGLVTDADGRKPIANATVYLKNFDHIGIYTDSDGAFLLSIPGYAQNDILVISSMGYASQEAPLRELQNSDDIHVLLKPMAITLDEVTVKGRRMFDLEKICLTAVQRIADNYPDKRHYIKGFYRKVSTDSTKFTGLVEAHIGIADNGYQTDVERLQIQVLNARHGDNTIVWDSLLIKMGQKTKLDFNPSAFQSLHRLYESNAIRMYHSPTAFFNVREGLFDEKAKNNGIKTQVELGDYAIVDGDTVLYIDYRWFSPGGKQLDAIRMGVNIRDYAIVEFERGIFGEQVHLKFKKQTDGRYYPVYIKRVTPVIFDKVRYKRYYNIEVLEADGIEIKSKRKLDPSALENRAVNFDPTRFEYDSAFWWNYIKNNPHPIAPGVLKSLERTTPLKQQFHHGKK